jgi:heme transport system substrate-binding protein
MGKFMRHMCVAMMAVIAFGFALVSGFSVPAMALDTVQDARGIEVEIGDTSRIVSIGGSVTEIIYALGKQDQIVAIDTTSTFPVDTESLPNIGYMRALSPEGVLSTAPTLILAIDGAGPAETIDVLAGARVPFVVVPNDRTLAGTIAKVRFIAGILNADAQGEVLIHQIEDSRAQLDVLKSRNSNAKRVMFILSLRDGSVMAAGRRTSAAAMIELAGGENALQSFDGFKTIDSEGIIQAAPDVILMMKDGNQATQANDVFDIAAIAATPAGETHNLVVMDGLYLLGFGPRTPQAALELANALYNSASETQ